MLDNLQIPKQQAATKTERLNLVVSQVIDQLPQTVRMLAGAYLNSFRQVLASDEVEENIDEALDKLRQVIDYVEYGADPCE